MRCSCFKTNVFACAGTKEKSEDPASAGVLHDQKGAMNIQKGAVMTEVHMNRYKQAKHNDIERAISTIGVL